MKELKVGGYINTPRFLQCQIAAIFADKETAMEYGFTEPTHFNESSQVRDVLGKSTGINRMIFAVVAAEV